MRWRSIRAVIMQELYVTRGSWEVIFDILVFAVINIFLFGFISAYLAQSSGSEVQAQSLLIAVIFWEVIRVTQYSTSVSSMWNVWSHNLCNMFIAPIKIIEYLLAHIITAVIKSLAIFTLALVLVKYMFNLNILSLGIVPIAFSFINMVIFAIALGLVLIGLVFKYGTRIQALSWGVIYIFQPLCAVYFPVSVLPAFLQPFSYLLPVTYFFEWLRAVHAGVDYGSGKIVFGFILNVILLLLSSYVFSRQLASAKQSGQLVRNDL
jgi:ABC-2 type transport system permease protein